MFREILNRITVWYKSDSGDHFKTFMIMWFKAFMITVFVVVGFILTVAMLAYVFHTFHVLVGIAFIIFIITGLGTYGYMKIDSSCCPIAKW
jgi:uncharacterized membrane protein